MMRRRYLECSPTLDLRSHLYPILKQKFPKSYKMLHSRYFSTNIHPLPSFYLYSVDHTISKSYMQSPINTHLLQN
jgi:hypothetical protein